jgi:hypothetical protein
VIEGAHVAWWLPQSSKLVRPDIVGSGGFDSHTLPPRVPTTFPRRMTDPVPPSLDPRARSRPRSRPRRQPRRTLGGALRSSVLGIVALVALVVSVAPAAAQAQVTDTVPTRPSPSLAVPKPAGAPPITPRRAFLYSLAFPGTGQSILSRPTAGSIFAAAEAGTLAMIAKSVYDLRAARAIVNDSVVYSYTAPTDGSAPAPIYHRTAGALRAQSRIPARRAHVEDWVTILIVNHFLAGADAYVAANLWDVPTDVSLTTAPAGGIGVAARFAW